MPFGTLSVTDLLATNQQSVAEVGEQDIFQSINALFAAHNALLQQKLGDFVDVSTDVQRRYGGVDTMTFDELDEFGRADAQKVAAGDTVAFPLRRRGTALQWTRTWFEEHTAAELMAQVTASMDADARMVDRDIKRAIFTSTNSTFVDRLVNNVSLGVKALVNADSASIPPDPYGNTFNVATHTHYTAINGMTEASVVALVENVIEHFAAGSPQLYINRAQETAVRAFTGFVAYLDARVVPGSAVTTAQGALSPMGLYDRPIGLFNGAEVWVKPWIPASYLFAWVRGQDVPLVMRIRRPGTGQLELEYDDETHPLRARGVARKYGIGVWSRINGAVLYIASGTYAVPVFT